jgi:amino-acid N-acetyltransferase
VLRAGLLHLNPARDRGRTMNQTLAAGDGRTVTLRPAAGPDQPAALRLLADLELPTAGVADWWRRFTVAESGGTIVGVAGVESYGTSALLRSVAVRPDWRSSGIGRALVKAALEAAREEGVRDVYLLTTTAECYFPRLGFSTIPRDDVPLALQASVEFRGACPDSATVMHRSLPSATL